MEAVPVAQILTTLLAHGIGIENVEQVHGGHLLTCSSADRFGGQLRYVVVYCPDFPDAGALEQGVQRAQRESGQCVYVGPAIDAADGLAQLTAEQFLARFGGPVGSLRILEPTYGEHLITLGENALPKGVEGVASDLYEVYVVAGIQFLVGRRVIHYGRSRSGEAVPDGIALGDLRYSLLDSKAAAGGFAFDANTIRQFGSYVADFKRRYANLGTPASFICVSSAFADDESAIRTRAQRLQADHQVSLSTITSSELADAVKFFKEHMHLRQFVDWRLIFAAPIVTASAIQTRARAAARDGLVTGEE